MRRVFPTRAPSLPYQGKVRRGLRPGIPGRHPLAAALAACPAACPLAHTETRRSRYTASSLWSAPQRWSPWRVDLQPGHRSDAPWLISTIMPPSVKIPVVIAASRGHHRAAISPDGRAVQNGGLSSCRPKSCGGESHTKRQPGPRQENCSAAASGAGTATRQPSARHHARSQPCPCWQLVGYDHQSGSEYLHHPPVGTPARLMRRGRPVIEMTSPSCCAYTPGACRTWSGTLGAAPPLPRRGGS
jgi:hypothetical protein